MKKHLLSLTALIVAIGCMIAYNFTGSEVAPDGTLVEPFFLIPMGYLFFAISIVGVVINTVAFFLKPKKSNR